jgi:hypothetical protein
MIYLKSKRQIETEKDVIPEPPDWLSRRQALHDTIRGLIEKNSKLESLLSSLKKGDGSPSPPKVEDPICVYAAQIKKDPRSLTEELIALHKNSLQVRDTSNKEYKKLSDLYQGVCKEFEEFKQAALPVEDDVTIGVHMEVKKLRPVLLKNRKAFPFLLKCLAGEILVGGCTANSTDCTVSNVERFCNDIQIRSICFQEGFLGSEWILLLVAFIGFFTLLSILLMCKSLASYRKACKEYKQLLKTVRQEGHNKVVTLETPLL